MDYWYSEVVESNKMRNNNFYWSKYLWIFLFLFKLVDVIGQESPIVGAVLDRETKEPLPYASIRVLGKPKATVSNSEGNFVMDKIGIALEDTLLFSYMGYEPMRILVSELQKNTFIYLRPSAVNLNEVQVLTLSLSAEEIIKLANRDFEKNRSKVPDKQKIFFHKYDKVPFQKENKIVLKETNFVGMDKKTFDDLVKKIPNEFIDYQDAIVEWYRQGENTKLVPVKGISLEEGSQQAVMKEFENKLGVFFKDIENSMGDKDLYYKVRSGILSKKVGNKNKDKEEWNSDTINYDEDTLHYTIQTESAKDYLGALMKSYTRIESDNWEFINSPNKYNYKVEDIPIFNDERVYQITFTPKKRGLFEGTVYISTSSYAVLQLDFSFAKGKKSDTYNILGYKHSTDFKEGHIIFEKGRNGYYAKYIHVKRKEFSSLNRDFSVLKKEKRFLFDKELNEMKLEVELFFNTESYWELLVLEREEITIPQYEKVKEPTTMKFKKEYAYSPEIWDNRTVIVPTSELKKYKRK